MQAHAGSRSTGTAASQRLLEPAVLTALAANPGHGYDLRKAVEQMTDGYLRIDPPGIYRLLRKLEQEGIVESSWTEGVFGPQRRRYSLTDRGWTVLQEWRDSLVKQHRACELTIESIDTVLIGVDAKKDSLPSTKAGTDPGRDGTEVDA